MCGLTDPAPRPGADLPELLAALSDDRRPAGERRRALRALPPLLAGRRGTAGGHRRSPGRWLVELATEMAPHVPVRDLATLRAHHRGLTGNALADAVVRSATRTTAGIGAGGGALAALQFAAPPVLLSAPVQVAAETLAVLAVEVKLVGELHAVYGVEVAGSPAVRGAVWLRYWAQRRGVNLTSPGGLGRGLGAAGRRELRQRLMRRARRNAATMLPLLAGAVVGAELNRRETARLAATLLADLRA